MLPQALHTFQAALLLAVASATLSPLAFGESREMDRLLNRSEKIVKSIRNIQANEDSKIPASVMREAEGIILLKQYEAGVIFGAKGGFGLVVQKLEDGSWGIPAWVRTTEITGGIQLGAQKLNVLLVIMNKESLKVLRKSKFQLGLDATLTRGPTGSNYETRTGFDADILVYTDFQGYYAGATLGGSMLVADRRSNELTYGEKLEIPDIVSSDELTVPDFLQPVLETLVEIESTDAPRQDR